MLIVLKNGFKFTAKYVAEQIDINLLQSLEFREVAIPTGDLTSMDVLTNFTAENLSSILIFDDSGNQKQLKYTYTAYKYLHHFNRNIYDGSISTTIALTTKNMNPLMETITGSSNT